MTVPVPLSQKVAVPGVPVPDGNTDSEELFTTLSHLHVEPHPEAKSFGSLGSGSGSTTLDGNTDSEEPFTNIPHLHVEPLPEADGVEHVIAAGQLRFLWFRFRNNRWYVH